MLRGLTGRPVLGVLPFTEGLWLDVEDSLSLDLGRRPAPGAAWRRTCCGSPSSGCRGSATSPTSTPWPPSPGCWSGSRHAGRTGRRRPGGAARHPGHRRRPGLAAPARPRGRPNVARRPQAAGARHLRWLPDARREIDDTVESGAGTVPGLGLLPVRVSFGPGKQLGRPPDRPTARPWRGMRSITAS